MNTTLTVLVVSGSALIRGGSSSSTDVSVSSVVASICVFEDMGQTSVGIQPPTSGTIGSLCFNESKARDFEKIDGSFCWRRMHFQESPARNREDLLGDVCSGF